MATVSVLSRCKYIDYLQTGEGGKYIENTNPNDSQVKTESHPKQAQPISVDDIMAIINQLELAIESNVESNRINAQANKENADSNKLNAMTNERQSRVLETLINILLDERGKMIETHIVCFVRV